MNRAIVIRASIIFGILILAILIPLGLEAFTKNENTPTLSNPDDVYLTVDGVDVTNGDLWATMKNVDGVEYLVDYTLEFLLADEIAALTQTEIDAEIKLLTYLTEDEDLIAKVMEDEEIHQDYLNAFNQNLIVMGYDPDDQMSVNDFVALSLAKTNYTRDLIDTAVDGDADYVTEIDVESFYNATSKGDVCSVDIRFSNSTEVTAVFQEFSLILNYEGGIGEYIGTEEWEDLLQSDFNSSNTIELSDEAVFSFYIKIYNYMNPWATQIPEGISQVDYCANYADIAVKNYEDMVAYTTTDNPNNTLAGYLFTTLSLDEGDIPYTYTNTKEVGDFTMLAFKVSEEDVPDYGGLSAADKAELRTEVVEAMATDTKILATMDALLADAGFEIFDPQLRLKYEFAEGITFDNSGSKTLLAKINDLDITVDMFFDYMEGRIGVFYSIETAKANILLQSDYYEDLYGTDRSYFNSKNDKMKAHVEDLDEMKALFGTNYYANYGYSSADMTWSEFIYLAFSLESETEVIENMFVVPSIQNEIMHEEIDYEDSVAYMQDQIFRYYSLNIEHVLLYLDFDYDFAPDDFVEYRDSLTGQEATDFQALLVAFQNQILAKVNDDEMTFQEVVDEYSKTLLTDDTSEWAQFKQAGLFILTESLGAIDQATDAALDEAFVTSVKRMYDVYIRLDDVDEYNDDQITVSEFGVHYISATEGANFDMHTAKFTDTEGDGDPENNVVLPTLEQVELYLEIKYAASIEENTTSMFHDDDVYAAVEYYYGPIYQSYMSQTAFGAYMAQYILDNNGVYTAGNTVKNAQLVAIAETLNNVNYPDLFGTE